MAGRELYEELPSTQDRAVELARTGAGEGTVVVARRQTRGRGRDDRSWESPPGGLYLSVVLAPRELSALLPLAIGAELGQRLALEHGVRLRLKWPNDLLAVDVAGAARKLAGLLVDQVTGNDGSARAVVGVGVNAARPTAWSPGLRGEATALEELTGRPVDLERLERLVVDTALEARRALEAPGGAAVVLARTRGLLFGRGAPVTVDGVAVGVLAGLGEDGSLELLTPGGLRAVRAGHVRVGVGG